MSINVESMLVMRCELCKAVGPIRQADGQMAKTNEEIEEGLATLAREAGWSKAGGKDVCGTCIAALTATPTVLNLGGEGPIGARGTGYPPADPRWEKGPRARCSDLRYGQRVLLRDGREAIYKHHHGDAPGGGTYLFDVSGQLSDYARLSTWSEVLVLS